MSELLAFDCEWVIARLHGTPTTHYTKETEIPVPGDAKKIDGIQCIVTGPIATRKLILPSVVYGAKEV